VGGLLLAKSSRQMMSASAAAFFVSGRRGTLDLSAKKWRKYFSKLILD
jgi:hypothetical protein